LSNSIAKKLRLVGIIAAVPILWIAIFIDVPSRGKRNQATIRRLLAGSQVHFEGGHVSELGLGDNLVLRPGVTLVTHGYNVTLSVDGLAYRVDATPLQYAMTGFLTFHMANDRIVHAEVSQDSGK
jgi:hypothetical protein